MRGGTERRAPRSDRPARAAWAALRQFLFREFFLEIFPATLVSRATRNQTDPLAPLGRRCGCWPPSPFLEFGLGAGAAAAAPDSMVWSAAPGERSEIRGLRQQPARNRTDTRAPSTLIAPNPRARAPPAEQPAIRATRSVRLLAGVGNFFFVLFLAANSDDVVAAAAGRAVQLRGDRKQAALKDQRNRAPSTLIAPNPRARARRRRATRSASRATRSASRATRDQSDPLAPPGRRCGCWPASAISSIKQ